MLCISVGPRVERPPDTKDTLSNVEEAGAFVINIVSLPLSTTMHESSRNHPPEADEWASPPPPVRSSRRHGWGRPG